MEPYYAPNRPILDQGVKLRERYCVGRVLGAGGFGITYQGYDEYEKEECAIKEYFPMELAMRCDDGKRVQTMEGAKEEYYSQGMKKFVDEAEILHQLRDVKEIVGVKDYFTENGTAYLVMEYLYGVDVEKLMFAYGGKLNQRMANQIVVTIAKTLEHVHRLGLIHRDVSPENIIIMSEDGSIKLIDFGATRSFLGNKDKKLSVILRPGFAPLEQYSSQGAQGTWTDVYALAATYYYMLSGVKPTNVMDRISGVELAPLEQVGGGVGSGISKAVSDALSIRHEDRIQTMREFIHRIEGSTTIQLNRPRNDLVWNYGGDADVVKKKPYLKRIYENGQIERWLMPLGEDVVIGRSPMECGIVLDNRDVSRKHCAIRYNALEGCFLLRDTSMNGTYTDYERVGSDGVKLNAGENFYISTVQYRFVAEVE